MEKAAGYGEVSFLSAGPTYTPEKSPLECHHPVATCHCHVQNRTICFSSPALSDPTMNGSPRLPRRSWYPIFLLSGDVSDWLWPECMQSMCFISNLFFCGEGALFGSWTEISKASAPSHLANVGLPSRTTSSLAASQYLLLSLICRT